MITHYDGFTGKPLFEAPQEMFEECHHQGKCDVDVDNWLHSGQIYWTSTREDWIASLRETGGWTEEELSKEDDETLKGRVIWIAAGDWQEEQREQKRNES